MLTSVPNTHVWQRYHGQSVERFQPWAWVRKQKPKQDYYCQNSMWVLISTDCRVLLVVLAFKQPSQWTEVTCSK